MDFKALVKTFIKTYTAKFGPVLLVTEVCKHFVCAYPEDLGADDVFTLLLELQREAEVSFCMDGDLNLSVY